MQSYTLTYLFVTIRNDQAKDGLHDNASSQKCEAVKSFFGFWKGESFKPSTLLTWPESLWLLFISKA